MGNNTLLKDMGWEGEEGDVSSYWMTLWEMEETGI